MTDLITYPTSRNDASEDSYKTFGYLSTPNGVVFGYESELAVFADSTGLHVKVNPGKVSILGFIGILNNLITLGIDAADASNARYDRVVARLDMSAKPYTIRILVLKGTAGAGGPPDLVNSATTIDVPLAVVFVDHGVGSLNADDVTIGRTWTGTTPIRSYSPAWSLEGGQPFTLSLVSDASNLAEFQVSNGLCWVNIQQLIQLNGTSFGGGIFVTVPVEASSGTLPTGHAQNRPCEIYLDPVQDKIQFYGGDYANGQKWVTNSPFWFRTTATYRVAP